MSLISIIGLATVAQIMDKIKKGTVWHKTIGYLFTRALVGIKKYGSQLSNKR
jgi:hypothetical protein|tara:strand:- start:555 stop:710 length:156 start_codon:yes stop_codon:yes gene_type:complete